MSWFLAYRSYVFTQGSRFTTRRSSASKVGDSHHHHLNESPSVFRSSIRILSNLVAAGLVLVSLIMIVVLLNTGMFHRRVLINDVTYSTTYYNAYGQNCKLNAHGFEPNSCADFETSTTTAAAWTAIGQRLALQWDAQSSTPFYVTTCIEGPPGGWAAVIFLASYDSFPECQPAGGPQIIDGMAVSETTVRDDYPDGVYMLMVYNDRTMLTSVEHTNSDGTTDRVILTNHSLITTDGTVLVDSVGINTVEHSLPLGRRYMITGFAYEILLDITLSLDDTVAWWNVGRQSKMAVANTWDTGHDVANSNELIAL
ncbi:hypothetical protein As57867_007305, partial [Aphanomyces stellatus]